MRILRISDARRSSWHSVTIEVSDRSISEIARDLGISSKTLYGWVRKHKEEHGLIEARESDDLEKEIKRLKKENARLKMECDILKKATAYFAKETA